MIQPPIETPCIKVCAVNGSTSQCVGCGRSLQEIASWASLTPDQRRIIMDALPERLQQLEQEVPS